MFNQLTSERTQVDLAETMGHRATKPEFVSWVMGIHPVIHFDSYLIESKYF